MPGPGKGNGAGPSPLRGDPVRDLEIRLRERYDADGVLLTDSGTNALRLAIRLATPPGETVALPAFSCYDMATAAVGADVGIVLYDVEPATLAPDPASLEAALAAGVAAVVVAPLYGVPVRWDIVRQAAERHGAAIIEDAAQGHGAGWQGRRLGSLAPLSILSFGRGKGWTGSGGGALLWRGERGPLQRPAPPDATDAVRAALVGLAQAWLARPALYWIPAALPGLGLGETRYHPPSPVRRMSPFQAALLLETEAAADREAETRRAAGAELARRLDRGPEPVARPRPPAGAEPGWLRFPVLVPGGLAGLPHRAHATAMGVAPSYPTSLERLPAVRERRTDRAPLPGAERLARDLITLPTHGALTRRERDRLPSAVRRGAA